MHSLFDIVHSNVHVYVCTSWVQFPSVHSTNTMLCGAVALLVWLVGWLFCMHFCYKCIPNHEQKYQIDNGWTRVCAQNRAESSRAKLRRNTGGVQIEMCGAKRERNRNAKWSNICCRWVCYVPTNQSMHDVFCLVFVFLPLLLLLFIISCRCLFSLCSRCACAPLCVSMWLFWFICYASSLHPIPRFTYSTIFFVAVFPQPPYRITHTSWESSNTFVHSILSIIHNDDDYYCCVFAPFKPSVRKYIYLNVQTFFSIFAHRTLHTRHSRTARSEIRKFSGKNAFFNETKERDSKT